MNTPICECGAEMRCATGLDCWCEREGCEYEKKRHDDAMAWAYKTVQEERKKAARTLLKDEIERLQAKNAKFLGALQWIQNYGVGLDIDAKATLASFRKIARAAQEDK